MSTAWAVYGGRFDPFHNAHFALARRAAKDLPVDKVLLVPNGEPAHQQVSAKWPSRLRMCQLGLGGLAKVKVAELEPPGKPRFACDTAQALARQVDTQVWVVGADSFANIDKWKRWRQLLGLVNWAVMPRAAMGGWRPRLPAAARLAGEAQVESAAELAAGQGKVWVWDRQVADISANELRDQIASGKDGWKKQVPDAVARYVEDERLYICDASI